MSVYGELDPMVKHRRNLPLKTKGITLLRPTPQTWHTQLNTSTSKYPMIRGTM